jgi:hypothetical protein
VIDNSLLGALLQALKLTQPWTDGISDLAAGGASADTVHPGNDTGTEPQIAASSSSDLSHLEQARQLIKVCGTYFSAGSRYACGCVGHCSSITLQVQRLLCAAYKCGCLAICTLDPFPLSLPFLLWVPELRAPMR